MTEDTVEYAEVARATSERGELVLRARREEAAPEVLELRVNGVFVMDSFETGSERELAAAALRLVENPRDVLVGGLGLGFTAREVLADHRVRRVVAVEIEDALVEWMRDGTVPHGPECLADQRLHVVVADITQAVAEATPHSYDVALIDVDNGPGFLVYDANAQVYRSYFLEQLRRILRPGGAAVFWSAAEAPDLEAALSAQFAAVEATPQPVSLQGREHQYWIYLARVPSAS